MKAVFALVLLALVAVAYADVSELKGPSNEYLPPHQHGHGHGHSHDNGGEAAASAPTGEYLPPHESGEPAPAHTLGADGYRYKAPARRFRYRF